MIYDIDVLKSKNTLDEVHCCDFVFVCVPTPMFEDGSQDLSYVESVFKKATNSPGLKSILVRSRLLVKPILNKSPF